MFQLYCQRLQNTRTHGISHCPGHSVGHHGYVPFLPPGQGATEPHVVLVVSLPIIVLRHTRTLSRSTKFGLATFLCLSIFMVICAIIRIAGFHYKGFEDDTWEFFWQHTEGAVSVMMASITAFRTLFIKQNNNSDDDTTSQDSSEKRFWPGIFKRFQALARAQPDEKPTIQEGARSSNLKLPKIPSPVFTGLRTFIRRNNKSDAGTAAFATLDSSVGGSDAEYHVSLGTETRITSGGASRNPVWGAN